MNRVALYLRVSTSDQSVDLQRRDLLDFAERRGWTIAAEFSDLGVSGAKDSRPQLNALMELAKKRKIDCVAVWRFDRFARSVSHLLRALETFQSLGIDFVSYSENIDTSQPMGRMVFTILAAVSELERSLIRERSIAGQRTARAKALKKLAADLGHEPTPEDIRRHLNFGRPRTKVKPTQVAALRAEGKSYAAIAKELKIAVGLAHRLANKA